MKHKTNLILQARMHIAEALELIDLAEKNRSKSWRMV